MRIFRRLFGLGCSCPAWFGALCLECCGLMPQWRVCIVTRIDCSARPALPSAALLGHQCFLCVKGSRFPHGTTCNTRWCDAACPLPSLRPACRWYSVGTTASAPDGVCSFTWGHRAIHPMRFWYLACALSPPALRWWLLWCGFPAQDCNLLLTRYSRLCSSDASMA